MAEIKNYREFLKNKEALRDDVPRSQQQERNEKISVSIGERDVGKKKKKKTLGRNPRQDRQPERQQATQPEVSQGLQQEKSPIKENNAGKEKAEHDEKHLAKTVQKGSHGEAVQQGIEHDIRDQALGQIYRVPGADLDYDEVHRMSQNGIRDASELASESLQNDGYPMGQAADIAAGVMEGFLKGEKSPDDVKDLCSKCPVWDIVTAYANIAKQTSPMDADKMDRIGELCNFEHPAFEWALMVIRDTDKEADKALEQMEFILGQERER